MNNATELAEFVRLWDLIQEINFTDSPDEIVWRWTVDGVYTAKSAYKIQFKGSYYTFQAKTLWKAQVEGKHHFFLPGWWRLSVQAVRKEHRRATAAILIYTWWNIWNERNRRIFQGIQAMPQAVFGFIEEEISLRQRACGAPVIP
ncbi:hypothetical protein SETIT_7G189700v2 [Setaria italica]|uniref:Reverse transcriptase zinc-binding domain-containing protein n=1 Tax=Setaria italica TaxID=4555 RepID=A0A368RXA5_SETIT|nr:hypothetical protein SETIT_7G189700v2 [Setaria italica]